jgi:hypothetical protein
LDKYVISEKEIVGLLALAIEEGIIVVALEGLDHVAGVRSPLVDLAVGFHCVDKLGATILNGNDVAMVMVHVCEEIDGIRIVGD